MADLLALALRAIEDPDAAVVLGDAVLASGWEDHRVRGFFVENVDERGWKTRTSFPMLFGTDSFADAQSGPGAPSTVWARAVAAVLLFEGWPTTWPLALENARKERDRFETVIGYYQTGIINARQMTELLGVDVLEEDEGQRLSVTGGTGT